MNTTNDELLTVKQAAAILQLNVHTVWRYIRKEKLRAVRINSRNVRIQRIELYRFLHALKG